MCINMLYTSNRSTNIREIFHHSKRSKHPELEFCIFIISARKRSPLRPGRSHAALSTRNNPKWPFDMILPQHPPGNQYRAVELAALHQILEFEVPVDDFLDRSRW